MFKFFFSHIAKNIPRSLSIVLSIAIIFLTITGGWYLYKNITSAIEYYASHGNNERRVSITASSNILNLFNAESSMSPQVIESLMADPLLSDIQVFRLVDIPVSAKFGFFSFSLESDIPVFAVTDGVLSGTEIPVWMSRTMIDLYNTQFAGSSPFFPHMREDFLIWQNIVFTFGKSKIFQSTQSSAHPITGTITAINHDFPGFGLVLPESIVRDKMQETGYKLGAPYKIIAYMADVSQKENLKNAYPDLTITFEVDAISETKTRIMLAAMILIMMGGGIIIMMGIVFLFLLGGYFRERKHIFKMVALFDLRSIKSYIMTAGEPLFLSVIGVTLGYITLVIFSLWVHPYVSHLLETHGILFPVTDITPLQGIWFGIAIIFSLAILILFLEWHTRRRYSFRS